MREEVDRHPRTGTMHIKTAAIDPKNRLTSEMSEAGLSATKKKRKEWNKVVVTNI